MKNRFYLFGSNHMQHLLKVLQHEAVGYLFGVSPLSNVEQGRLWQKEASKQLENADYIVLDLQTALQTLLSAHGFYLTASDRNVRSMHADPIAVVEPMHLDKRLVRELFEPFVQLLQTYFDRRHIILVRTYIPEFYWIDKSPRMRDHFRTYEPRQNWLRWVEDCFAERTRCRTLDIERFYFHRKETGRPLTELIFEDYCYLDMAGCIDRLLQGEKNERPCFRYSLRRYVDGKFTLYQRAFSQFLQEEYLLDALILSSPKEFVEKNMAELEKLDVIDWTQADDALVALKTLDVAEEIRRIMYTFARVVQGVYDDPEADYPLLLRSNIVPTCLLSVLREKMGHLCLPAQINAGNAGYYFARMQGCYPEPFVTEQTVILPPVIDIFGSCVSRTIINVCENDFAVNYYWFQVPPVFEPHEPIAYPEDMFPEKPHWADRLVKAQFDGTVPKQLERSPAQWLMIDLFAFVTVVQYRYKDLLYTDYNTTVSKKLGAEKAVAYKELAWDDILKKMESWFDAVRRKYEDRIILVNAQRKPHWIGDDGVLYRSNNPIDCTEFLEYIGERVAQKLDCWCIDFYKEFLPQDNAYISNTPAHKEDICYLHAAEILKKIVAERPENKCFSTYPNELRLQRLLELRKYNCAAKIEQAVPLNDLDSCVIRMDESELSQYAQELNRLYAKGEGTEQLKLLLQEAAERPVGEAEFDTAYSDYSEGDIVGYCEFQRPHLRRVEIRAIENDRSMVKLYCASAPGSTVQILRKTGNGFYELLKQAPAGYSFDTEIQPLTDYTYIACSAAKVGEKTFIGAFTPPKHIRTSIAVPRITSAVEIGGINRISWQKVPGAAGYYIYHKQHSEDTWSRCDDVSADVHSWSEPSEYARFYTIRAYDEDGLAGGHNPASEVAAL